MKNIQARCYFPVKTMWRSTTISPFKRVGFVLLASLAVAIGSSSSSYAVVVIFDGFGDGNIDNDAVALETTNDPLTPNWADVISTYQPLGEPGGPASPKVFDPNTYVTTPTTIDNFYDRGIRWNSSGGITNSGDPAGRPRIIDDTAGVQPETVGNQGFFNAISSETQNIPALDSGLAMGFEAKGRTRSISGFFEADQSYANGNGKQRTVQLGPNVDDEVKVSFDIRVWMSAPNFNTSSGNNHAPTYGVLRFGLYQDADNELGLTNIAAGPPSDPNDLNSAPIPVVWGAEDGWFRGERPFADASGDPGWFARVPLKDKDTPIDDLFGPFTNGGAARIVEETNPGETDQFLAGAGTGSGGDTQTVAGSSDPNSWNFVNLDHLNRYNISLSLKRFDETGGTGDPNMGGSLDPNDPGDNIVATLTVKDLDSLQEWTLSGFNTLFQDPNEPPDPDLGFDSDAWDYFTMDVAGASFGDEYDFVLDNFMVEVFGSNEPNTADFDGSGIVDGGDFLLWQLGQTPEGGSQAELALWEAQNGTFAPPSSLVAAVAAVPEPSGILLMLLGLFGLQLRPSFLRKI